MGAPVNKKKSTRPQQSEARKKRRIEKNETGYNPPPKGKNRNRK